MDIIWVYQEHLRVIATYRDHDDPMAQRLGTIAFSALKMVDDFRKEQGGKEEGEEAGPHSN